MVEYYTNDRGTYIKNPDLINFTLGEDYQRDEELNELVKDKTIAYVGPAPNLQDLGMGEFIDSHDLVFRLGDSPVGFMGRTGKEIDYGSRTDVLVHSFNDHDRPELEQDLKWLRSLKYFLEPMVRSYETPAQEKWFKKIGVPVHNVPDHHLKSDNKWNKGKPGYVYDYLGSLPNTGFIGLLTMLNYDVKHLYMTGFTFYNMGNWSESGNCYFDEWYGTEKYKKHGLNESQGIHNPSHDIKHFRDILKVEKHRNKIKLDEYLIKHFGTGYRNKENTLSLMSGHDAGVAYINKNNELKVLEYERFVKQRYASFTHIHRKRGMIGTDDVQRRNFLQYIKDDVKNDIELILYDDPNQNDISLLSEYFPNAKYEISPHHTSHAACGYYQSGFDDAIIVSIDGGGYEIDRSIETKSFLAKGGVIESLKQHKTNLGVPYGHIGQPISEIKSGLDSSAHSLVFAGKVMGLCAYGKVRGEWLEPMREFYGHISYYPGILKELGKQINLNLTSNSLKGQDSYDLAATSQHIFEEIAFRICKHYIDEYNMNVVLVGGCALNVLFNQKLYEYLDKINLKLYVPPNPNDCGLALGQFLLKYPQQKRNLQYSGFELLDQNKLDDFVKERNAHKIEVPEIVKLLKRGKLIGLASGCSEVGPRALGNRSIICDPSFPDMKDILNSKVKFREWFRPFAPVARMENAFKYFNNVFESKYMSFAPTVKEEYIDDLKAVTHIDKTSRLQTVTKKQHKLFYNILEELDNQGYVSVILNTSFNILGNPILTTIKDALYVLDNTKLDYVIVDGYLFGENNE